MKKIRCADDSQALQDWASSKEPEFQWALQRLRGKDRKRYVASLEWWMNNSKEEWVRQAFAAIATEDPDRAAEIAKGIPPGKKEALTVSAFSHLAEVDCIPDEKERVKALIQVALDPKSGWEQRGRAIKLLVPPDQPLRYPDRNIDDALVKLLSPELTDDTINFTIGNACRAIAQRGKTENFPKMVDALKKVKDSTVYSEVLGAVTQLSQCAPAKYNSHLLAVQRPQLKRTNNNVPDLLMAAWSADLRALKPDLEGIATSGPDDYEDERAHSYGGEVCDIGRRFHLARKIASPWNEEDLLTKCRLLLTLGLNDAFEFVEEPDAERLTRMKSELAKTAKALTPEQKKQIVAFLAWYQNEHISNEKEPVYRERRSKFVTLAKGLLELQ